MTEVRTLPKLLVVTPWFPTVKKPGAGIFIYRDVLLLSTIFDVTVVHVGAPQFFSDEGVDEFHWDEFETIRAPITFSNYRSIARAARVIREQLREADAFHTMAFEGLTPVLFTRVSIPWIHTEHWSGLLTEPSGTWRSRQVQLLLRKMLRRPQLVIAVSEYLAAGLKRWTDRPMRVIGNEVQVPAQLPAVEPWDFRTIRMLTVGALEKSKGVHHALEALIELRKRGYDAELTCAGEGSLASDLVARAEQAHVADRLRLLGQLPPDSVRREMQKANIAVMPTHSETFGIAIAEALTEGLPLITGDTGGFTDFLPTASSITIPVAEFSGSTIADKIIEFTQRDDLPTRGSIAKVAANQFDNGERLDQYREAYESLGISTDPDCTHTKNS